MKIYKTIQKIMLAVFLKLALVNLITAEDLPTTKKHNLILDLNYNTNAVESKRIGTINLISNSTPEEKVDKGETNLSNLKNNTGGMGFKFGYLYGLLNNTLRLGGSFGYSLAKKTFTDPIKIKLKKDEDGRDDLDSVKIADIELIDNDNYDDLSSQESSKLLANELNSFNLLAFSSISSNSQENSILTIVTNINFISLKEISAKTNFALNAEYDLYTKNKLAIFTNLALGMQQLEAKVVLHKIENINTSNLNGNKTSILNTTYNNGETKTISKNLFYANLGAGVNYAITNNVVLSSSVSFAMSSTAKISVEGIDVLELSQPASVSLSLGARYLF